MKNKFDILKWNLYNYKYKKILLWGFDHDYIRIYDDELIKKLRNIYYGSLPASIILLSNGLCNGNCYSRALLLSQAFLNDDKDVRLIYATIDGLKYKPGNKENNYLLYADHCFVERTTKEGKKLIYDTSDGFIYDKKLYWLIENPKVRKIMTKDKILEYVESEYSYHEEDIENDKYIIPLILPFIESSYKRKNELYSKDGIELLQREVEHFKNKIKYNELCKKIQEDRKSGNFQIAGGVKSLKKLYK